MKVPSDWVAVDTNVLLRALVEDPVAPAQCKIARERLQRSKSVYIAQIVQVELVWVLRRVYDFSVEEIAHVLGRLQAHAAYLLQASDAFDAALNQFRAGLGFSDAIISFEANRVDRPLLTFDRKLAKHGSATLLASS